MQNLDSLAALAERIDKLLAHCEQLHAENARLRQQESALLHERDELQRSNDLAKARVEAIILRLKALEAQG